MWFSADVPSADQGKTKTSRQKFAFCQGRILQNCLIRGATLVHSVKLCACRIPTYPRQLTYANTLQMGSPPHPAVTVSHTSSVLDSIRHARRSVPCTLLGPFDDLCFTRFTAARALCGSMVIFISDSTVYVMSIAHSAPFVKGYREIFCEINKQKKRDHPCDLIR